MSHFRKIDKKIKTLADSLNAKLSVNRPNFPDAFIRFEERRIDWKDGEIHKAIIIQPTFEGFTINSEIWNLYNIAWINDFSKNPRPTWENYLVKKKPFIVIEKNIDELLSKSKNDLIRIKEADLTRKAHNNG